MDSTEITLFGDGIREASSERLLYEDSSQEPDILEDPPVPPRIGKDYQVEVPPLESEAKCLQLSPHAFGHERAITDYRLGSAIPVIWVLDIAVAEGNEYKGIGLKGGQMTVVTTDLKIKQTHHIPLPGAPSATWTNAEKESFLLGLYIFGKNLFQLKEFISSKNMGDILSFYYGAFYRTDQYCRWSDCRKVNSRKCINGQRIFTGWRQNELLSRVSPSLSEESHRSLLEATRRFNANETSFENYVFHLKKIVGMEALIDGIGIGKGKDDLTDTALDPVKGNRSHSIHSEIPVGKACSSLSSSDIVRYLTGDYRLSKARSNDLFWEAVWPRLLAKGWHSEQPKEKGCAALKHPLVFLVPGVRKFSRKKLVRGEHYFDSVSDVLSKVATESSLLELGAEGAGGSGANNEFGLHEDPGYAKNALSDYQRNCYLRPSFPASNSDLLKFTVVDTTLVQGEPPFKVRELRSLPVDNNFCQSTSSSSDERGSGSSKAHRSSSETSLNCQDDALVSEDKRFDEEHKCEKRQQPDTSNHAPALYKGKRPRIRKDANVLLPDPLNKNKSNRRVRSGKSKILPPVPKQGKLNACSYLQGDHNYPCFTEGKNHLKSETKDGLKSFTAGIALPAADTLPYTTPILDRKCPRESVGITFVNKSLDPVSAKEMELTDEKSQRTLIDLNLPQSPPDFDIRECTSQMSASQDDLNVNGHSPDEMEQSHGDFLEVGTSNNVNNNKQSSPPRRQSTRNRPLTTRALEALESGFLNTKRERGSRSSFSDAYRPSRRARKTAVTSASNTSNDNDNSIPRVQQSPVREKDDDCTTCSNETTQSTKSYFDGEGKGYGYFDFFNIH